ncbi:MAG: TetR/AcrR family transcriptional regulator [Chloroflexota bacterium]
MTAKSTVGRESVPGNARGRRTRSALLAAARGLLEERGFDALTIGAVADRAGVTRRAVYLHFASRSALVGALFDYVAEVEGLDASLQRVREAPDAVAALDEWARHEATFHGHILDVARALEHVGRADPDAADWRRRIGEYQRLDCRLLARRLHDERRLAPGWSVDSATDMLWALTSTEVLERLLVDCAWQPAHYAERYVSLLRSTFVAETTTDDSRRAHGAAELH